MTIIKRYVTNERKKQNRKGAAVIMPLALLAILTVFSTGALRQVVQDRAKQENRLEKNQRELLQRDLSSDAFKKLFANQAVAMTAELGDLPPYRQGKVIISTAPNAEPRLIPVERPRRKQK